MTIHTLTHCHGQRFNGMYARDENRRRSMWETAAKAGANVYTVEWEVVR